MVNDVDIGAIFVSFDTVIVEPRRSLQIVCWVTIFFTSICNIFHLAKVQSDVEEVSLFCAYIVSVTETSLLVVAILCVHCTVNGFTPWWMICELDISVLVFFLDGLDLITIKSLRSLGHDSLWI